MPILCGIIAHVIALRIDPNVPKLALLPAVVVSFGASILAFVVALVWISR